MDLYTLLISALVVVLTAVAALGVVFTTRRTYAGFGWWFAAALARAGGLLLFLLPHDRFSPWLTVVVANFMAVAEAMFEVQGMATFRGRALARWWMIPVSAAFFLLFSYFTLVEPDLTSRIAIRSAFLTPLAVWSFQLLLTRRPVYFGAADLMTAAPLVGVIVFNVVTPAQVWRLSASMTEAEVVRAVMAGEFGALLLIVVTLLATLGQVLMNQQRLVYDHDLAEERLERDIEERAAIEEKLRISEERHRLIAENARDVVWTMSPDGRITYVSPSIETVRGFTPAEAVCQAPDEIHPPESLAISAAYLAKIQAALADGRPLESFRGDLEYKCKDGSTFWTEVMAFPVRRSDGSVELVGVTRDLSQRKLAEEQRAELEAARQRIEKSESLARMAGAVSHHLNNQLMVVTGYLEMAMARGQDGPIPTAELDRLLSRSLQAAHEAARVGEMMSTYLGHMPAQRQRIDLSTLCSQRTAELHATVPAGVALELDFPEPGPVVLGDENQLRRVLTNLVANAWESDAHHANTVRVSVKTCAATDIAPKHRFPVDFRPTADTYACLEVSDRGSGITAEQMEKLFDPFYTTKLTGRGVGLPTVLGIVRSHDGVVTVDTKPGEGSVFRVFLPVASACLASA